MRSRDAVSHPSRRQYNIYDQTDKDNRFYVTCAGVEYFLILIRFVLHIHAVASKPFFEEFPEDATAV